MSSGLVVDTSALAVLAADAWERWGKGRRPAALNIIDCCSYALATQAGEPLLAVGDGFTRTDIEPVDLTV